jgi:hypothetical protein
MRSAIYPTHLHFHDLASHFLSLTAGDRFLRFGWVMTDVDIVAYVETLLESIGNVLVVVEPAPDISGVLHLQFASGAADLGLSVSAWARGKGIGTLLLERAGLLASARGIRTLFARNLNFNASLRRLAHRVGMRVACAPSARSTRLELPAISASAVPGGSIVEAITLADYTLRSQWSHGTSETSTADALPELIPN